MAVSSSRVEIEVTRDVVRMSGVQYKSVDRHDAINPLHCKVIYDYSVVTILEWCTSTAATEGALLRRYLTFLCSTGGEEMLTNKRTGSFTIHFPHVLVPSSLDRIFQKGKKNMSGGVQTVARHPVFF